MVVFVENIFKKLERSRGFHPATLCSPKNAIPPEKVLHHHRSHHRGGTRGQERSLLYLSSAFNFTT